MSCLFVCHSHRGVPDSESNEIKDLREAAELIEAWHVQLQGVQSVSRPLF